jgi:aspartyl-tRNA(Asn)/glutamyl-tRNA(Gln) amidotransferase subunit A
MTRLSLRQISHDLRTGELRAQGLMQECAEQFERLEPRTNAYKTWGGATSLTAACALDTLFKARVDLGPLMGVPTSVKDLYGVPGLPVFAGSSDRLAPEWETPGPLIKGLLGQAAVVTGKTHTVEFAFGGLGLNTHWGAPANPWDDKATRIPGGSSSGAGVSLSQGSALLALGTDTAGSVRIPAAVTGNIGLKTTKGRWPTAGIVPLSPTLDTPGILTRSVEDAIYAFDAIESGLQIQTPPGLELDSLAGIRVGVPENFFWDGVDASIIREVERAILRVESLGATVVRTNLPGCDMVYELFQAGGVAAAELTSFLRRTMPQKIARLDPVVKMRVEDADRLPAVDYLERLAILSQAASGAARVFEQFDVLLTPTVAITPPLISDLENPLSCRQANMMILRNSCVANLMSLCALTMPVGKDALQMPVGLQLMCGAWQERKLLAIAGQIERSLGRPFELLGVAPRMC